MRNDTRQKFTEYLGQVAALNGVPDATVKFTAAPSVQQTLETKIQESSDFLGKINQIGVVEQSGEKIGLGVSGPVAGTTNTATTDRAPSNIIALDDEGYSPSRSAPSSRVFRSSRLWASRAPARPPCWKRCGSCWAATATRALTP